MKLSHLSFRYPDNDRLIFNELSLNLVPGQIHFLLGRNGEGKTTLLDILSGLIEVDCSIEDPFPRNEILYHIQGVPLLSTIKGKELAELILCVSGQCRKRDLSPDLFKTLLEGNPQSMEKIVYLWKMQYGKMSPGERRWFMVLLIACSISLFIFLMNRQRELMSHPESKSPDCYVNCRRKTNVRLLSSRTISKI